MKYSPVEVVVWGDYACFSRPELKVERVSYEVMTPSAARGILEAIFWKPEFSWYIREIHILKPIRYFSLVRNEVTRRANYMTAKSKLEHSGIGYTVEGDRTQRHTLGLRNVAYRIVADIYVHPGVEADEAKYRDQFQRRVKRGQCYSMPYLGCREFTAQFAPELPSEQYTQMLPINIDLGRMLFDIDYDADESGRGKPRFFHASLTNSVLTVPGDEYRKRSRNVSS